MGWLPTSTKRGGVARTLFSNMINRGKRACRATCSRCLRHALRYVVPVSALPLNPELRRTLSTRLAEVPGPEMPKRFRIVVLELDHPRKPFR
jgi:hypothetical protein